MWSDWIFLNWITQIIFCYYFMRIVFFAIHRAVRTICAELISMLMSSRLPSIHSVGQAGILHLSHFDKSSHISSKNFYTSAQNHRVIGCVISAIWADVWVHKTHLEQPLSCIMCSVKNFLLYKLQILKFHSY